MALVQEFVSKWQSNLVKHEGQLTSMRQTLLHYLHKRESVAGGSETTPLHRLLSDARAHVLAPLQIRMKDLCDSSSDTGADIADRIPDLTTEADTPSVTEQVLFSHSTSGTFAVVHCMECSVIF